MATTYVILTEKVPNLGVEADIVKVRAGYARNYLLPQGLAMEKTKTAERRINLLKAKRAERAPQVVRKAAVIGDAAGVANDPFPWPLGAG